MKQITKLCLLALLLVGSTHVFGAPDNKPFAEERIVLQISDPDPFKQTLVLNVANMGKALGHEPVLHASARPVPAGVVRIIELQNQGYKLIKP